MLNWKSQPGSLVGKRVEIKWANGKFYGGKITKYIPTTKEHVVIYDDGQEIRYDLNIKTFRIEGSGAVHHPGAFPAATTTYGSYAGYNPTYSSGYAPGGYGQMNSSYSTAYGAYSAYGNSPYANLYGTAVNTPYTSRVPNAATEVVFHVRVDSRVLFAGDRVQISGNIPELRDVEMFPSIVDPTIFTAAITLPYALTDTHVFGLFHYQYVLVSSEERISEGQMQRSEQNLKTHYFHVFRPNYSNDRFRSMLSIPSLDNQRAYIRYLLSEVEVTKSIPLCMALQVAQDLLKDFPDATRQVPESMLSEYIDKCHNESTEVSPTYVCILLGILGSFGKTSDERLPQHITYIGMQPQMNAPTFKDPPAPTLWCHYIADNIPIAMLYSENWVEMYGDQHINIARGIAEVVERLSEHGFYNWLRVMPLVQKYKIPVRIVHKTKKKKGKKKKTPVLGVEERFTEMAQVLCAVIQNLSKDQKATPATDTNDNSSSEKDLICAWINALVNHSPSLANLTSLITIGVIPNEKSIIPAIVERLKDEDFNDASFDALSNLLEIPLLQCVEIAVALLQNDSIDELSSDVLDFVRLCVIHDSRSCDESGTDLKGGVWHDLAMAAKEWIRRHYAKEPTPPMIEEKKDFYTEFLSSWATAPTNKAKSLTKEEQVVQRRNCLYNALIGANKFFAIPFFASGESVLFELNRCWFFKGSVLDILDALCWVGRDDLGYHVYHDALADYLDKKACGLFKDIGQQIGEAIDCITSVLNESQPLSYHLLYKLALSTTWKQNSVDVEPPLLLILENATLWRKLHAWNRIQSTPLSSLMQAVRKVFAKVVHDIMENVIVLPLLHIICEHEACFLEFISLLNMEENFVRSVFDARKTCLRNFDLSIQHLQTYLSYFCCCGVKIDSTGVRKCVEVVRNNYNTTRLCDVGRSFSSVLAMNHVEWLHDLKNSELFLQQWRECGRDVIIHSIEGAREALDGHFDAEDIQIDFPIQEDMSEEAIHLLRQHDTHRFQRQDQQNRLIQMINEKELTQDMVVNVLIPQLRMWWCMLSVETFSGSISLSKLDRVFNGLRTEAQIREELLILSRTDFVGTALEKVDKSSMINRAFSDINDYMLLRKLKKWLPSLVSLQEQCAQLFKCHNDDFCLSLQQANRVILVQGDILLKDIPNLVGSLRDIFSTNISDHLDYLSLLSSSPNLLQWLLRQSSTDEFNRLLQVIRPCTDEPRLLSAIASLVHTRNVLLPIIYVTDPYADLKSMIMKFRGCDLGSDDKDNALWHLSNIVDAFDSLMDMCERQTRSPGIKSCYDLKELLEYGTFVMTACDDPAKVLSVRIVKNNEKRVELIDYLFDLRSKLLMTEIPPEVEAELHIADTIESFVSQLVVLVEMTDVLVQLTTSGHSNYQNAYAIEEKFVQGGEAKLQFDLKSLQLDLQEWEKDVFIARSTHYFLNFFTMREILQIQKLLQDISVAPVSVGEGVVEKKHSDDKTSIAVEADAELVRSMQEWSIPRSWAIYSLSLLNNNLSEAIDFCYSNNSVMERLLAEAKIPTETTDFDIEVEQYHPDRELLSLLHLVICDVDESCVHLMVTMWRDIDKSRTLLINLGGILDAVFDRHDMLTREICLPISSAENATDMLLTADEDPENKLPVYAACAENRLAVIDTVLSVYVRRARIPTPGEIIFCSSQTTTEELNLLLMRFIYAKRIRFDRGIFTIADMHNLTYTQQCWLVEKIKFLSALVGHESAAILLLVSGELKQVAFNSLSSHIIELAPLGKDVLRLYLAEAFRLYCGETTCVLSTINGGGKSQYILSEISFRQEIATLSYCKIPLRESSTAGDLLKLLNKVHTGSIACHLDIGHVIPSTANTILFQLLFIGVLRDPESCQVYYRRKCDIFYLELPNSNHNRTAYALRFCNLLPFKILDVSADSLQLQRPYRVRSDSTRVKMMDYVELIYVCKWLRAIGQHRLQSGDDGYAPSPDEQITKNECYTLLHAICNRSAKSPYASWTIFNNFVVFLCMQFQALERYPLLQGNVLAGVQGLETFKDVFVTLLVETSADFALRSVPQVDSVGPRNDSLNIAEDDNDVENDDPEIAPGLHRHTSEEAVRRFQNMTSWDDTEHPIVAFNMDCVYDTVTGVAILSLNKQYLNRYIHGELKAAIIENHIDLDRDWSKITNEESVAILRGVEGLHTEYFGGEEAIEDGYVLTVDNMLKMLSIQLRLRYNIPVIIMGETGVGKSAVVRNMCAVLGYPLHTLNIHGGTTDEDIIRWMETKIRLANEIRDPFVNVIVFLDEINTCNSMGLFKEICCDRSMNGNMLPDKLKVIAACNPYRLRTSKSLYGGEEMAGLIFEHHAKTSYVENVGTGIKDPLRNLVYRVHPLPESMIDHVFDFGSLTSDTESLYIKAMLRKQLNMYNDDFYNENAYLNPFQEFVEVFSELICEAQECVRRLANGERSSTSLRDVARCVKVFLWFGNHFADTRGVQENWTLDHFYQVSPICHKYIRKSVILSLAYCYHARLPRTERRTLINAITNKWRSMQGVEAPVYTAYNFHPRIQHINVPIYRPRCRWLNLEYSAFISILQDTQLDFVSAMKLGDGIALNEALCENLFMILVSILNYIPIFVIGKPGSSKSLAMGLIQSNLNGDASDNDFLRTLPAVEVFSYQCSPLSTSAGIEKAFDSARQYLKEASNTVVVVLLDEVGLAEQSPHLPLKVLHKVFDEARPGESVVSISNWALDPAKMNRAVHLYRPAPTVEDLSRTAEGMVRSANLKGYLHQLAKAYDTVYHQQEHPDFWGLREFYSTVRAINASLSDNVNDNSIDQNILLHAVLRNFGGRPNEMDATLNCFFNYIGLTVPTNWKNVSIESLIVRNLQEYDARHMMLLTRNNAALSLLLDRGILKQDRTEIIFGSDFPLDQNDLQICMNIQRVKLCMAEGVTVVLVHCESLYESLYDLLNQHYVEYGGQTYVRLAFGTYTRLCPIHRQFRVVVIVETYEAYTRLAPPLLNRFEKQVFERKDVLLPDQIDIVRKLERFAVAFASCGESLHSNVDIASNLMRSAFSGYHSDILSSLVLSVSVHGGSNTSSDDIFIECVDRLLWIATPEATCRLITSPSGETLMHIENEFGVNCSELYFHRQRHSSVSALLELMATPWSDKMGAQIVLTTHAPFANDAVQAISAFNVKHIVLHELDQERELRHSVTEYFRNATEGSLLLVQCDPLATSRRRIEHTKFLVELCRARRLKDYSAKDCNSEGDWGVIETKDDIADIGDVTCNVSGLIPGIHVVLLIHLPRGDVNSSALYNIDFDTRWRHAFVDAIQPSATDGLPDTESMIGRSLLDVFKLIDVKKTLARIFRFALAKMEWAQNRNNDDIRRHIETVLQCLEVSDFVSAVSAKMTSMMENKFGNIDFNVSSIVQGDHELQVSGTFQAALHKQIYDALSLLFAVALSHMLRNSTLDLFIDEKWNGIWLYFFEASFNISTVLSNLRKARGGDRVAVRNDDCSGAMFRSQFPFSFFLANIIDYMRPVAEPLLEIQLYHQFKTLNLDFVSNNMSTDMLQYYCHDMICMKCKLPLNLSRQDQSKLIFHCLSRVDSEEPLNNITQLHYRLWKHERLIDLLCDTFNCSILNHSKLQHCILSIDEFNSSSVQDVFREILQQLIPSKCNVSYSEYISGINTIRPTVLSFIDLLGAPVLIESEWHRIQFCLAFMRDVAMPINLPLTYAIDKLRAFETLENLASFETLHIVLDILCATNKHIIIFDTGVPDDFLCPLTLEKFVDPVIAADGFTYERKYIEDSFARGNYRSPRTNVLLPSTTLVANTALINRMKAYYQCDLNKVLEYFIFDILFSPIYRENLSEDVLVDLMVLASGHTPKYKFDYTYIDGILPASASTTGILREIFSRYNGHISLRIRSSIEDLLLQSQRLDTEFCAALVSVLEDNMMVDSGMRVDMSLLHSIDKSDMYNRVVTIAKCRKYLLLYAEDVTNSFQQGCAPSDNIARHASEILSDSRPMTRSIKTYFLKQLLSTHGVSYLRSILLSPTMNNEQWLQSWKKSSDTLFTRFLGANKLPKENPFLSFPRYSDISTAVCKYIRTSNEQELLEELTRAESVIPVMHLAATLLLVCFEEVALLQCLHPSITAGTSSIHSNLQRIVDKFLSVRLESNIKDIVLFYSFGSLGDKKLFDESSLIETILQARLHAHIIACIFFVSEDHPFAFLRRLLLAPKTCNGIYFPTMAEDMAKMAQNVMGGRWYACPNKHPFYVDQCGRPTRVQKCAECGANIGGENHNLLETNIDIGNVGTAYNQKTILEDRSERNYCLRTASEEAMDKYFTARGLSPSCIRVIRIFLHATMVTGSTLTTMWNREAEGLFNKNFCNPVDICTFLQDHLIADWNSIKMLLGRPIDEVALLLHLVIIEVCYGNTKLSSNNAAFQNLASLDGRQAWETAVGHDCVQKYLIQENLSDLIADASRKVDMSQEDNSTFLADLAESIPLSSYPPSERVLYLPGLWLRRKIFSLHDFTMALNLSSGAKEKNPVLYYVLTQDKDTIQVLQYLPAVFEWFRLLHSKFSGHIDRETARVKLVEEVFSEIVDISVRQQFEAAFVGFAAAWNMSWHNVQKYGCIRFASDFNNLVMSPSVPVSFSLPNEHDEGNCPLALVHYLVEKHNALAQLVDESLLLRIRRGGATDNVSRVPLMSSRFISSAHTIRFNVDNLVPLFEKYCVDSSKALYDFDKAEQLLVDRYLSSIPAIDLEMRGFAYQHEQHLQGGIAVLKNKIKQHDISVDIASAIRRDIVLPSTAQQLLDILETVVSFLNVTGGSIVQTLTEQTGDMLLADYMKNVLLIQEKLASRIISSQIRLKNVAALWDILTDISSSDTFRKVHCDYKCDVRPSVTRDLATFCVNASFHIPRFLPIMKSFIVNSLVERIIAPETSAYVCLENLEYDNSLLCDASWFAENFPTSLRMGEVVGAYELINNKQLSCVSV